MDKSGTRAWRSGVVSRAGHLRAVAQAAAISCGLTVQEDGRFAAPPGATADAQRAAILANRVVECAKQAESFAAEGSRPWRWMNGALVEGAWVNLHAADEYVIELLPSDDVRGQVPLVVHEVQKFLRPKDPRRVAVEELAKTLREDKTRAVTSTERAVLGVALIGVHFLNAAKFIRVRSMRNLQLGFAAVFVLLAVGFAAIGWRSPGTVSVCLPRDVPAAAGESPAPSPGPAESPAATPTAAPATPRAEQVICPTGALKPASGDVALVEVLGLAGAAVAAALAVSGSRRPAGPYSTVVGQVLLKTVLGAMTALLGVWFLRAGFVPGVNDVSSAAEIVVYAVVFGYAQQLFTRLIDRRTEAADAAQAPVPAEPTDAGAAAGGG
jgi:hypothetical protein